MVKTDITQMSAQEIREFLHRKEEEAAKQLRENVAKWKEELEAYCQKKYGVSLATIFTASSKPRDLKQYKHPQTGETYTYSGRGKVPGWLKGADGKPNPQYAVPDVKAMVG